MQGGVLRVEAVDLLLLPLDAGGADHRPDPLDDVRPDLRRGVFQSGTLQFALHALQLGLGAVQFGALLRLERGGLFILGAHLPLLLFEQLDGLPLLLFETEQRVDVLLQILLLGNGLSVELLRGDVARLRTVDAALQSVFGHRRSVAVLILLETDARHDIIGAEAGPGGGFRAVVPFAGCFGCGGAGLAALARDDRHHGGVDMRGRFVAVYDGRDDILRPEGLAQPGEVVGTPLRKPPLLLDALHRVVRTGQHDADHPHLVRSDLARETGVFEAVADRFRTVGHLLGELDKLLVEAGALGRGVGGYLCAGNVGGHRRLVARGFVEMQDGISHGTVVFRRVVWLKRGPPRRSACAARQGVSRGA